MSPLYCPNCRSPREESPCFQCEGECEEFSLHAHERAVARWDKEDRAYEAYLAYQKLSPAEKAARVRASEAVLERIGMIRLGIRQFG
jgi:hypothetical protein